MPELRLKHCETDVVYIYIKLIASLAKIKGFSGWRIAKAEFKTRKITDIYSTNINTDRIIEINNKFIKQRKAYAIISASTIYNNIKYALIMDILQPGSITYANTHKKDMPGCCYPDCTYLFTLEYTRDDIKKYTEYTGDSNPIHQQETPVVPGFLMFGDMLAKELYKNIADNNVTGYVILFRNPLFADEAVKIYRLEDGTGKIIALQADSLSGLNPYASCKWELYPSIK